MIELNKTKIVHDQEGECDYCGLSFPHIHEPMTKPKDFIHLGLKIVAEDLKNKYPEVIEEIIAQVRLEERARAVEMVETLDDTQVPIDPLSPLYERGCHNGANSVKAGNSFWKKQAIKRILGPTVIQLKGVYGQKEDHSEYAFDVPNSKKEAHINEDSEGNISWCDGGKDCINGNS